MKLLSQIFLAFFRAGMLSYGGGPTIIPLIHREAVTRYQWLDNKSFSNIIAIGNTLPGPIATKLAGYIGYRVGGILGCLSGLIAVVLPTVLLMFLLMGTLTYFQDNPHFQGVTKGISPVIAVMLAGMAYTFIRKSWRLATDWTMILLILISWIFISLVGIHPAIIIVALFLFSLLPISHHLLREEQK